MEHQEYKVSNKNNIKLAVDVLIPGLGSYHPLVIVLHGFTECKDDKDLVDISESLCEKGFAVAKFDASGSGKSEGTSFSDFRVSNYYSDLECVFKFLIEFKYIDKARVSIYGHSMGGMLAIIFATKNPSIKSICAVSPTSSILEAIPLKEEMEEWESTGKFNYKRLDGTKDSISFDFVDDAKRWDALDYARDLKSKALFVVGEEDKVVPISDSLKIYDALSLATPRELLRFPGMGHYDQFNYLKDDVTEFFNRTLLN